jgi:outer membrane protein W
MLKTRRGKEKAMKKEVSLFCNLIITLLLGICLVGIQESFSAEIFSEGNWNAGIHSGVILTQFDKDYIFGMPLQGATDISIEGNDGWFIEAVFEKPLNQHFAVGIDAGYMRYDLDFTVNPLSTSGVSGDMGTMKIFPLVVDIKGQYPIEWYTTFSMRRFRFIPYAKFGVGGLFIDFKEDDYATSNGYTVNTDSTALMLKYGGGFDIFVSEHIAMYFEASYLNTKVKTDITRAGSTNTEDVKHDSWLIGGGLKYSF